MSNNESSLVLVRDALLRTRRIMYDTNGPLVMQTAAERIMTAAPNAVVDSLQASNDPGVLRISIGTPVSQSGAWTYFRIDENGS